MSRRVRTAVFPVAGLGTRFLPATKSMPKEMLTVVDKPLIQYAVEEAREAGIERLVMVTGRGKSALEDHFDESFELNQTLRDRGKDAALQELATMVPEAGKSSTPASSGRSAWDTPSGAPARWWATSPSRCCSPTTSSSPARAVSPRWSMRMRRWAATCWRSWRWRSSTPAATASCPRRRRRYACRGRGLVEKPKPEAAPSRLAVIGRYILEPEIFDHLGRKERGRATRSSSPTPWRT